MFKSVAQLKRGSLPLVASLLLRSSSSRANNKGILANKVAVITGSTDGIGFAIARRLAQDGAHVVVSSRQQQNVDRAVAALQGEKLSVTGTVCHVGKAEDQERLVAKALEHCGAVDILVCVAGVNPLVGSTLGSSEQVWDKGVSMSPGTRQFTRMFFGANSNDKVLILSVNVKAPALLLSQLVPYMESRGEGSVVLVSSIGVYLPESKLGAYNVSKTAILGLTKTLSLELAPKNIRVNCLVPGLIDTPFSQVLIKDQDVQQRMKTVHKIQRIGRPEDCAGLVSFLCSPDASYITGENIVVAGFSPCL